MKVLLIVACALLGLASAVSLNKGVLQPRFAQVRNHPAPTQDYQQGEDAIEGMEHGFDPDAAGERHVEAKYTPGASCADFTTCATCGSAGNMDVDNNYICRWVPTDTHASGDPDHDPNTARWNNGHCDEDRNPTTQHGEDRFECYTAIHQAEVVDEGIDCEDDDYSNVHFGSDPCTIASLDKAEPVFTTAQELGAEEGEDAEAAGDWIQYGMNRAEYQGYLTWKRIQEANRDMAAHNDGYSGDNRYRLNEGDMGHREAVQKGINNEKYSKAMDDAEANEKSREEQGGAISGARGADRD